MGSDSETETAVTSGWELQDWGRSGA